MAFYWGLDPKRYARIQKAYKKRKQHEIEEKDYLNWIAGKYNSYAYHSPKKYPDKPFLENFYNKGKTGKMDLKRIEQNLLSITKRMGGTIKKNG